MANKNIALTNLTGDKIYTEIIFKQVWGKVEKYKANNPQQKILMMAFGDTSQPLPPTVTKALVDAAHRLGDPQTYTGYEEITGNQALKKAICDSYYQQKLGIEINTEEVFISDGAQSVSVNIQELFAPGNIVAVQNPAYPSFKEGTLLAERPLIQLPCLEENNFIPKLPSEKVDIIYLCFPNNPTGAVATHEQLQEFVDYAKNHQAVIIYDAVYSPFIRSSNIPRSIYEIDGAKECAIEISSFSKWANFTGLRVGWCVIPETLTINNTVPGELNHLWRIRNSIKFWGTANIAQYGAIATLSTSGQLECQQVVNYYLNNARLLRNGLEAAGLICFGAIDSPFVWVKAPQGLSSWQLFEKLLESTGIVGVPGVIFGSEAEGFLRLSALGQQEDIKQAIENLAQLTTSG
ncbi:MAG: LL-diaminopimelate aminotransferase [Microcoleaceae cyanobacterium]